METRKMTLVVELEVLDTRVAPKFLGQVIHQLMQGVTHGRLQAECGDVVKWRTGEEKVEF